jgi:hypothetical protein
MAKMLDPTSIEFWFVFSLGALCSGLFILAVVLLGEKEDLTEE